MKIGDEERGTTGKHRGLESSDKPKIQKKILTKKEVANNVTFANKEEYIRIKPKVILTPEIRNILKGLEKYFKAAETRVIVTSGVRTPEKQLSIIKGFAIKKGLQTKFPSILTATVDDVQSWQPAWDDLLNKEGIIVNPPKEAVCNLGKRKGRTIGESPHASGKAFDLSGAPLNTIECILLKFKMEQGMIGQILVEKKNNAVHVGLARFRGYDFSKLPAFDLELDEFFNEPLNHSD